MAMQQQGFGMRHVLHPYISRVFYTPDTCLQASAPTPSSYASTTSVIDKVTDVTNAMNINAAFSIKYDTFDANQRKGRFYQHIQGQGERCQLHDIGQGGELGT